MRILAIETSCDETSAAIVEKKEKDKSTTVLSNITASSLNIHAQIGGIIPETAAREQVKYIMPVIIEALLDSEKENKKLNQKQKYETANNILRKKIDNIAVTIGPGLIGSLLVGVETAKTLAYIFNKPIIPVNHLLAHLYANFIFETQKPNIQFPFVGLIVSGGHTDLLYFKSHKNFKWLGGTRDDAAGEAMDKIARILGLGYPGGPEIEKRAKNVEKSRFSFKSPLLHSKDFDFSFSGLKTEVQREVQKLEEMNKTTKDEVCYSVQKAIVDVLVKKTVNAALEFNTSTILIGGGVSANQALRDKLKLDARRYLLDAELFFPEKKFSTDNAAMIGTYAAFYEKPESWGKIKANPELYFD